MPFSWQRCHRQLDALEAIAFVVLEKVSPGYFMALLTSSVRSTPSFSPSNPSTSFSANILHASLISASSSAEISLSAASLVRRVLAGCLPLAGPAVAAGRFLGGWHARTVTGDRFLHSEVVGYSLRGSTYHSLRMGGWTANGPMATQQANVELRQP